MCWPNSRLRRNSMNFGLRKMQMSSAAVPPKRIRPISAAPAPAARPPRTDGSASAASLRAAPARRRAPRPPARARPPREPFTSTVSPSRSSAPSSSAAALGVGDAVGLPGEPVAHLGGQRAHGHEQLDPAARPRARRSRGGSARRPGRARACRRARPPAARGPSRPGRRSLRAWTSGWRCSSR